MQIHRSCLKQDKVTFTHKSVAKIYIVFEINLWNYVRCDDPTQGTSLFGTVKLVKNADTDKYQYSGDVIGFDVRGPYNNINDNNIKTKYI